MTTPVAAARAVPPSRIRALLALTERPGMLSLAGGLPDPASLPVARIRLALDRALARTGPTGPTALQYGPTEGVGELRAVLDRHDATLGVPADGAHPVLVTTGSQQALDLLVRVLVGLGALVALQAPAYLGAVQVLRGAGATLLGLGGDDDGLDVDELARHLAAGARPVLVYVVANFHNPTGATLAAARRRQLAELADRYGFVVVEDDPYGLLRFDGPGPAPLAASSDRVVRVSSASKILAPGLRVGWLRGPAALVEACARTKQSVDLHTSTLDQLVVGDVLADDVFVTGHLAGLRTRYARRAAVLRDALRGALGERVRVAPAAGGLFTWVEWRDGTDTEVLAERALARGVAFVPGAAFALDEDDAAPASRHGARLCHATLDEDALVEAAGRLAAAAR